MTDIGREGSEELENYRVWLHELLTKLAPDGVGAEVPNSQSNHSETQNNSTPLAAG